ISQLPIAGSTNSQLPRLPWSLGSWTREEVRSWEFYSRSVATAEVDITFAVFPPDAPLPRVAADLAVLDQGAVHVRLHVQLAFLTALRTDHVEFIHVLASLSALSRRGPERLGNDEPDKTECGASLVRLASRT